MSKKEVPCPTCKAKAPWDVNNPYRPFCCERCKLIDLGAWADGTYTIPVKSPDDILDSEE